MNEMVYLVPSRGRPHNAQRLITAWGETEADRTSDLLFIVDMDDPAFDAYPGDVPTWVKYAHNYRRTRIVPGLNKWAGAMIGLYDSIGFMGDDHCPRTAGWAKIAQDALSSGAHVVYANDLVHGINLPTAVCLSSALIEALGWMAPPGLIHLYVDNAWKVIGDAIGANAYLGDDVIVEHVHPLVGKAPQDDTYRAANHPEVERHDKDEYDRWLVEDFPTDIDRVRIALGIA